jgi:hypothetical protein
MKFHNAFTGSLLKAESLKSGPIKGVIEGCELRSFDDGDKPVLTFGGGVSVVLNKTRWRQIQEITGKDDSDDWTGLWIQAQLGTTTFGGKTMDCIDIVAPETTGAAPPTDNVPF